MQKEQVLSDINDTSNVLPFERPKLLTGGNPPADENWLINLPKGSIFLARRKGDKALNLDKYMLLEHDGKFTNLLFALQEGKQVNLWVNNLEFSRAVDYQHTLMQVEFEYEEETKKE